MIKDEVSALINDSNFIEANLKNLDKQLAACIAERRKGNKNAQVNMPKKQQRETPVRARVAQNSDISKDAEV